MHMWHLGATETHRWDVMPMLYTVAITCAPLENFDFTWFAYSDRWCYKSHKAALAAFEDWDPTTYVFGVSEPQGWHRHPPTGRRRENGDPSTEEIRH